MIHSRKIRSEPHVHIANLILGDIGVLIERWTHRAIEEQPKAPRVHHAVLLDQLPLFLQALAASLRDTSSDQIGEHHRQAVEHGEQRWQAGWSLPELIRDYQLLRTVLFEHLGA